MVCSRQTLEGLGGAASPQEYPVRPPHLPDSRRALLRARSTTREVSFPPTIYPNTLVCYSQPKSLSLSR
ncbi:MAG: hypothetical protein ACLU38_01755 [Dysosmobacter sp.]